MPQSERKEELTTALSPGETSFSADCLFFAPISISVGKAKVKSAKETMNAMNSDVVVNTYREFVTSENIMDLIADYDFILSLIHI